MSKSDKLIWFRGLGFITTVLSLAGAVLALGKNWHYLAGVATLGCILYEARIRILISAVNHGLREE